MMQVIASATLQSLPNIYPRGIAFTAAVNEDVLLKQGAEKVTKCKNTAKEVHPLKLKAAASLLIQTYL